MVMAFGIFLLYPGQFLLHAAVGVERGESFLRFLSIGLALFAIFVLYRFAAQFVRDRTVLWDLTVDHIRIGTWIAGLNVLASIANRFDSLTASLLMVGGWIVWGGYIVWLLKMTVRRQFAGGDLNGSIFLTTVATQSIVISFVKVWPAGISDYIYLLISINVLGIVFYWISFALVWIASGIVGPIKNWIPQNNITHGALSISMLAAQMIEEHMPGTLPYFHFVIQIAWVTASVFVVSSLVLEIYLVVSETKDLLTFRMTNYARNFTYAMFFACTYYGYTYPQPSVMKTVLNPTLLLTLAGIVLIINVWELSHQLYETWFRRQSTRVAVS